MREIKFRAWDRNYSCIYDWEEICIESAQIFITDGDLRYSSKDENLVLMQYTGLKDKNGKEIYEGDILRSDALGDDGEGVVSLVIFEKGCFVYGEGDGCPIKDYVYMDTVIGNIYENPELKILFGVK